MGCTGFHSIWTVSADLEPETLYNADCSQGQIRTSAYSKTEGCRAAGPVHEHGAELIVPPMT